MDFKQSLSSWFGLGLLMWILQYPFQYIFVLIGLEKMQSLAVAIAAFVASMLFTYYFYPYLMSPVFKIYALLTTFCISMLMAAIFIMSNSTLRASFSEMMHSLFQSNQTHNAAYTIILMIIGLLIQFLAWYLFITLGNKMMLRTIEQSKN